ncbi:MAG: glycosyl hydrolase family 8 [Fibrobacter sp.]|nr:glycosyl hydrolase family 8 [Fibrobacter sp.]
MKNFFKIALGAIALTSVVASAAPQFPFPQNMKNPHGATAMYADPSVIQDHFKTWKKAWMKDVNGQRYILAPEGTCSTVSEAIAYGMLIMVYMDDGTNGAEQDFKNLYNTWTQNGGNGAGMNWRIGCDGGSGSASDADFDAALALIMASKQWNNSQYLEDAKKIIGWMKTNDINGSSIKPGSGWNDYFNPSYAATANFRVFGEVTNDASFWNGVISTAYSDLSKCQNSKTGLVTDWCDWGSHQPTTNSKAAVAQNDNAGFFDDAARTPWRMAWAYYWFGDSDAKKFNDKIVSWMYKETKMSAGAINSGYYPDGTISSKRDNFTSSTFSGGMGLAAASADEPEPYLETVYRTLKNKTSCAQAENCGSGVSGEKYYPATLNLLYLLLMTGNMPNLYNTAGFEKFTPDPSLGQQLSSSDGVQVETGDSTVGVSGFWNWGAYHDKLNIGTTMSVDSGASPLFVIDGEVFANASMEIGPEPAYDEEKKKAGLLKYPSAGIAMSFRGDEKGVDFTTLGVASVRINVKTSGTMRFALLYEKEHCAGCEPGILLDPTDDYQTLTFTLKPNGYTLGDLDVDKWMTDEPVPAASANDVMKTASGVKFEAKMADGGQGSVSVKSIEFLDASGNVIDPEKLVGFKVANDLSKYTGGSNPTSSASTDPASSGSVVPGSSAGGDAIVAVDALSVAKVNVSGMQIQLMGAKIGATYAVFSMQGKVIASGRVNSASQSIAVPNKGQFLVRVGNQISSVRVK